jgi:flavorubredoxin
MGTRIAEVGPDTYQVCTYLEQMDVCLNQYLVVGAEPLLFHTGMRWLFDEVVAAVDHVVPAASVRWVSFSHVEGDECGSMNDWLALAPHATVAHGRTACMLTLDDMAARPPRALDDGAVLDIGGHLMRWIDTPHVPHGWEAGLLFDETTRTLFCSDLFFQVGDPSPTSTADIVGPAIAAEDADPGSLSLHPMMGPTVRGLADLGVEALALMHGPTFVGDCGAALRGLADDLDQRVQHAVERAAFARI